MKKRLVSILVAGLLALPSLSACSTASPRVDPAMSILPPGSAAPEVERGFPNTACDTRPLAHVYNPSRLEVIGACKVFHGTVQGTQLEEDGDYHIYLTPFPAERGWAMNAVNRHYGWALAERMPMQHSISVPEAGDHVVQIGTFSVDTNHGWLEVAHPIFAERINRGPWRVWHP